MKRRTVTVTTAQSLVKALVPGIAASELEAKQLISRGAVYLNGRRARHDVPVAVGAILSAVLEEGGRDVTEKPQRFSAEILFEDAHELALNKPAGQVAQPTPGRVGESLLDVATAHLGHPAGLVHRLDKETSGVTVFGKTAERTAALAEAFRLGHAKKKYLAITGPGLPASGTIDLPLSKDPSRPGRWRASRQANGIDALTTWERLFSGEFCVVALHPQTGRTHQLRAHLASIGYPILGDSLYGGTGDTRCLLHAERLEVLGRTHVAPVPADMQAFITRAGL